MVSTAIRMSPKLKERVYNNINVSLYNGKERESSLTSANPVLEVCVDDPRGLTVAVAAGADRIELCAALALGGLTPAPGLIAAAQEVDVPVFAMIRPHGGGFVYGSEDVRAMARDLSAIRQAGLAGAVLGATLPDGRPDRGVLASLVDAAAGLPLVLHRAVDLAPDVAEAVETAVEFGFCRILTSGGAGRAPDGMARIREMARHARGRITIMAGGGVGPGDVAALLAAGADDLHASCARQTEDQPLAERIGIAPRRAMTDAAKLAQMKAAIRAAVTEAPIKEDQG